MTPKEHDALTALHEAIKTGTGLLDTDAHPIHSRVLGSLEQQKLAKHVAEGLWRITLRGVLAIRGEIQTGGTVAGRILTTIKNAPGLTSREIAECLDADPTFVANRLVRFVREGVVTRERGKAYRYFPA